jgi:hypothetical protein
VTTHGIDRSSAAGGQGTAETAIPVTTVDAKGDLIVGTGADAVDNLPVGANNTFLVPDSSLPTGLKWIAAAVARLAMGFSAIAAKGDLFAGTAADTIGTVTAGSDGQVLQANSLETPGVKWVSPASPTGAGKNIAARTNAAAPTTTIDMTADELVVRNSTGGALLLTTVSVSALISASGANGLDTGAEAGNTWYYGWVIYNPATATVAGLLSTSATAPTMPAGYTYKALVTAVRNGATDFVAYRQTGNTVYYEDRQSLLSGGTSQVEAAVSTASAVPPIAQSLTVHQAFSTSGAAISSNIRIVATKNFTGLDANTVTTGITAYAVTELPNISQSFIYVLSGANGSMTLFALGFKLPVGGE